MAAPRPTGSAALVRLRLSGVAFLLVIAALVGLTVALYQKAFTPVVTVTLQADRVGNQLTAPADVKLRGLIVGEVRDVSSTGDGADVELALQPDKVDLIPADVQARLIPKTLFGEKYVALVVPAGSDRTPIAEGDVIGQDRSETAIETERVLDDLMPLLMALEPDQLSTTLGALSTTLRGRGEALGANLERTGAYLEQFNPALPDLQQDLVGLADFSDTLDDTAPDLLKVLDDLSFSSRALQDQEQQFISFLGETDVFSGSLQSLLADNEQRLVSLAAEALPNLTLYAEQSPAIRCVFDGLAAYDRTVSETFGGLQPGLRISLEPTQDNFGYITGDQTQYLDARGPNCFGLQDVPGLQDRTRAGEVAADYDFLDGYRDGRPLEGVGGGEASDGGVEAQASSEAVLLSSVAAPVLGRPAEDLTDLSLLLLGPMARGTAMGLS